MLAEKYPAEIEEIIGRYPPGHQRSAVVPLLYLAQREYGHITLKALNEVAGLLGLDPTEVGSLVGFYTLLHDRSEGKYRIQICLDLPCALQGARQFAEELCENLGIRLGETTEDGLITVEEVVCLAGCNQAPVFQLQEPEGVHYHQNQTVESAMELVEELRKRDSDA